MVDHSETTTQTAPPSLAGDGIDIWSHVGRAFGYWLVAVSALLAGTYYADGSVVLGNVKALLLFSFTLYPCYVIYATVYDLDPAVRLRPANDGSFWRRYFRGKSNETWVATAFGAWVLLPIGLWLMGPSHPLLVDVWRTVNMQRGIYAGLLLFCHVYYAFWMLRGRHDASLVRVRYETLIPVMIVAFSFFTGATIFDPQFHASLYALPALIFCFFGLLHALDVRRRNRGEELGLAPKAFGRITTIFIIAIPIITALIGIPAPGDPKPALSWASGVTVAVAVGLYLSLFELWRLTGKINDRIEAGVTPEGSGANYYHATVVSHAVAIAALPLVYLFGNFGWAFVAAAICHAAAAFFIWYWLGGALVHFSLGWRVGRLAFGFTFFAVLAIGVYQRSPVGVLMPDRYPRDWSGISASLFVALLIAFLATPFVQYFTEEDGRTGRPRPFRDVLRSFFRLATKVQVFRLAAVLSGALFIATNFLYEVARSVGWGISAKASVVFWIYAAVTVIFSVAAFFAGAGRPPGGVPPGRVVKEEAAGIVPPGPARAEAPVATIVTGVLQSLRVLTGAIVFLGVLLVGIGSQASVGRSAAMAFAVALVVMASFALNDYYDWRKDTINAPHRAVPSGRLTPSGALSVGLAALMLGSVIGLRTLDGPGLLVFLTGAVGGASYNEFVRRCPELKGVATGLLCGLIVCFDVLAFHLSLSFLWLGTACVVFVVGRELLMDVRDKAGDAEAGMLTLAVRWGDGRAVATAFGLLSVSTLPFAAFVASGSGTSTSWWLVWVYFAVIATALVIWHRGPWPRRRWVAIEVLKCALLAGVASMVAR